MAIRILKPTTPGQRGMSSQDLADVTTTQPVKSLLRPLKRTSGRNHRGVITSRRRGGRAKRLYRLISWHLPDGFKASVRAIEYDPNRGAHLARLQEENGRYHYILACKNMNLGQVIQAGPDVPLQVGNRLKLRQLPLGSVIHNIALRPDGRAQLVRGAGTSAQLTAKEGDYASIKLPSGEIRLIHLEAQASLGVLGGEQRQNVKLGKAGRARHLGRRPRVRGVAMSGGEHPHAGGEGKSKGYKTPRTPWGQATLGYRTRPRRKSNRFIVRTRHQNRKRR